jgi:hypothetical protein
MGQQGERSTGMRRCRERAVAQQPGWWTAVCAAADAPAEVGRGLPLEAGLAARAAASAVVRLQSALLAAGLGRAAARAAAEFAFSSLRSAPMPGGTGVPSCIVSLDAGEPLSTPAGICDVCDGVGCRRGGACLLRSQIGRASCRERV